MLEQNRLREEQMQQLVIRLLENSQVNSMNSTLVQNHLSLIQHYDGETGDTDLAD